MTTREFIESIAAEVEAEPGAARSRIFDDHVEFLYNNGIPRELKEWEIYAKALHADAAEMARQYDALATEVERLKKLAYLGEHHFDDLTYKARLDELVPLHRATEAERDKLRDLLGRLLNGETVTLPGSIDKVSVDVQIKGE